jgi:hypothetical protein
MMSKCVCTVPSAKKEVMATTKGKKNANVLLSIYILHIRVSNVLRYILKLFQSECKIACHVCEECLNFARQPHHFINNCH